MIQDYVRPVDCPKYGKTSFRLSIIQNWDFFVRIMTLDVSTIFNVTNVVELTHSTLKRHF